MTITIYPISAILGFLVGFLIGWFIRDAISSRHEIKEWWDSLWGM
jgi:multisubunit Na+/H+ antiporter MnhE subunit